MKYLLILLLSIITLNSFAQFTPEQPNNAIPKPDYKYILVWRNWEGHTVQHGDMISNEMSWDEHFSGFNSLKEVANWLNTGVDWVNSSSEHHDIYTRINENNIIALYDLTKSKKLTITFKTEEKSLPKRVEIQAEKWKETTAEIKEN